MPFGLREGRLFEPLQVEVGLRCGCACPGCGAPLVAKHVPSGLKVPHFSHASGSACSTGLESALHLAAKQLIEEKKSLCFPRLEAVVTRTGHTGATLERRQLLHAGGTVRLTQVRVEEAVGNIRPDLIVQAQEMEVFVEVACTSFVTPTKYKRIEAIGKAVLEIDLSDLEQLNFDALALRLFVPSDHVRWIYHPGLAAAQEELSRLLEQEAEDTRRRWEASMAQWRLQQEAEAAQRRQAARDLKRRAEEFARRPHPDKFAFSLDFMGATASDIRPFLPVSARSDSAIKAPALVWQTSVFAALIHTALARGMPALTAAEVLAWLNERFEVDSSSKLPAVAVWYFLSELAARNLLHRLRRQEFLVMVPGVQAAHDVARDTQSKGRLRLDWAEDWPGSSQVSAVANVFSRAYPGDWGRVAARLSMLRGLGAPEAALACFQNVYGMDALRRFILSAGFARGT